MKRDVNRKYFLRVSHLEIYNEKLKDLLLGANGVQGDQKLDKTGLGVAFPFMITRPAVSQESHRVPILASTNFMN